MTDALTLTRPDDWHLHLRDGEAMGAVLPFTARVFARAIVMPNLKPPVATVSAAAEYRGRIVAALPNGAAFDPLMTLYLTDQTSPAEVERAATSTHVHAFKLYPAGVTTNAEAGVADPLALDPVLGAMQELDVPLLVHAESPSTDVDVFDREARFLRDTMAPLVKRFPRLRVVVEHLTSRVGVEFVRDTNGRVAGTITPQHLLLNRNALFAGGLRPHHYCLPVLKREEDRHALVKAATSGDPKFFLGTDSAPHARGAKECDRGCAGVFTAHAALELYAEAFDAVGALERLEGFASTHGATFYGLPRNRATVTIRRQRWTVPAHYPMGDDVLVPFRAGGPVAWRVE